MPIIAKRTSSNEFVPAPSGAHAAVCVDVVDLGILEVNYGGKTKKQHKIRVVWQISENMGDGKPFIVQKRYTLSLHEKAGLTKDLESWRGRSFTEEEANGFDVETIIGVPCMVNVIQQQKEGSTYANITAVMRLPKGMTILNVRDYIRVKDRKPEDGPQSEQGEPIGWGITDDDVPF